MNVTVDFRDEHTKAHFILDVDPARLTGARSTFGPVLQIGTVGRFPQPTKATPLLFSGSLNWSSESNGLRIPQQPLSGGTSSLLAPATDVQLAAVERARKDGRAIFEIRLSCLVRSESGEVLQINSQPYPYAVPIERWHDALDACGYGRIRIIELPPLPEETPEWKAAADELVTASIRFRSGDYSASATSSRAALESLVVAIAAQLGFTSTKSRWGDRVNEVADRIREMNESRKVAGFQLNADVLRSLYWFSSSGAHPAGATREDAEYALTLTTGLYAYVVRAPIPRQLAVRDGETDEPVAPVS